MPIRRDELHRHRCVRTTMIMHRSCTPCRCSCRCHHVHHVYHVYHFRRRHCVVCTMLSQLLSPRGPHLISCGCHDRSFSCTAMAVVQHDTRPPIPATCNLAQATFLQVWCSTVSVHRWLDVCLTFQCNEWLMAASRVIFILSALLVISA